MKQKLKDICTLEKGKQIDTKLLNDSNQYRYINGGIKESGFFNDYNTEGKTVLISEGGASCGYVNYVNEKFWCGCHCYRLTNISIYPKYLFYSLKGSQTGIMELRTGAAMPNIKKETLKDFEITVCDSLPEQQKIAAHLDSIQSAIDNKKQQLSELDELVKSKFVEMFGENPVESGKWKVETLGEVSNKITDGTHKTPAYLSSGITFISAKNILNNKLDFSDVKFISVEEYNMIQKRCCLEIGDLLLSKSGSLGQPAIVETQEPLGLFESLAIVKYKRKCLNSVYLRETIKSDCIQNQFKSSEVGVAVRHLHLNVIAKTQIPLPPIELQNNFATFVQKIDTAKSIIKKQLSDLQELLDSKMDEYFGE